MRYIVRGRKNPLDREAPEKYYCQARVLGTISLKDICADIAVSSSLTRGDVANTIMSFLDTIPKYLKMGYSVNLDELGTFRLSLNSKGSDTPDEVSPANVKSVYPIFTPSTQLKKELEDTVTELFPEA